MNTTSLQYLKLDANLERLGARMPGMAPVGHAVHVGMVESLGIMQQGKVFEDFVFGTTIRCARDRRTGNGC